MVPMTSPSPADFGRVDPDGTVYVRTSEGERSVGQIPGVSEAEALAFYTRRYEALDLEVTLLERRIASGALSPDEARQSINLVKKNLSGANAVGDLGGLSTRLEALAPVLAQANEARKAERARQAEVTRETKEGMVAGPPTTRCGTASRRRGPPTPVDARRSSPSRPSAGRRPGRSRSRSSPRRATWPARPSGVRQRVRSAT